MDENVPGKSKAFNNMDDVAEYISEALNRDEEIAEYINWLEARVEQLEKSHEAGQDLARAIHNEFGSLPLNNLVRLANKVIYEHQKEEGDG